MIPRDRILAQTFRESRWLSPLGAPACPDCFDGVDLAKPVPDPLTPGLSRYHCTVCRTDFSDVKGTVFQTTKPVSLSLWAYLVMLGDPARLDGMQARQIARCWVLADKIKNRAITLLWRKGLDEAGVTAERLRGHLNRQRRAA